MPWAICAGCWAFCDWAAKMSIMPITAPFALAPGEERALSAIATLPRGEIAVLTAGDRPMFVPLAAVGVRYRSGQVEGLTAGAFALGINDNRVPVARPLIRGGLDRGGVLGREALEVERRGVHLATSKSQ